MDSDLGLCEPWEMDRPSPLTDILDEIPVYYPNTLTSPSQDNLAPDLHLHIYTDGSAKHHEEDTRSSWAVIIMAAQGTSPPDQDLMLLDWLAGNTEDDPLHPLWLGAETQSSRSGEGEAMAWALLYGHCRASRAAKFSYTSMPTAWSMQLRDNGTTTQKIIYLGEYERCTNCSRRLLETIYKPDTSKPIQEERAMNWRTSWPSMYGTPTPRQSTTDQSQ